MLIVSHRLHYICRGCQYHLISGVSEVAIARGRWFAAIGTILLVTLRFCWYVAGALLSRAT